MFQIYSDNIIVKGYKQDLLVDFARDKMTLITKELSLFIETLPTRKNEFSNKEKIIIEKLISLEIIFYLEKNERKLFPEMNLNWDFPATISNAVIEVSNNNIAKLKSITKELEKLNCFYYAFVISEPLTDRSILILENVLANSSIICLELILNYFRSKRLILILEKLVAGPRLKYKIKVFNCKNKVFINKFKEFIILREGPFSTKCCGYIHPDNFNINIPFYTESLKYNTCLNRKISIDRVGNIKNCLNMNKSYGQIGNTTIKSVIEQTIFTKLWHINKDKIDVCKICEFRHVCTDCRAFIDDPTNLYSKPLKCGYNPYEGKWEEWSKNPLKSKAIAHYGLDNLIAK